MRFGWIAPPIRGLVITASVYGTALDAIHSTRRRITRLSGFTAFEAFGVHIFAAFGQIAKQFDFVLARRLMDYCCIC